MKFLTIAALLMAPFAAQAQIYEGRTVVEPSLIADATAIVPGEPFRVALVMKVASGWHTYWQYPGDAGSPASIRWELPKGFEAGPIQWPIPETIDQPEADLQTFAYSGEVLLMQTIRAPADLAVGAAVELRAAASWLVCAEVCIPGKASLSLSLPVAGAAEPAHGPEFEAWSKRVPAAGPPPFPITWTRTGDQLTAKVSPPDGTTAVEFFPLPSPEDVIGHTTSGKAADGTFTVGVESSVDMPGVLAIKDASGERGWDVKAVPSAASAPAFPLGLLTALGFGFLGGLILNLMPCVLPVISLKIFGFVRQAGQSRRRIALHGLTFAAGIFAWFLALGILILILRSGGTQVTWAFQFQNPVFNLVVATLVFAFALNLFGVFELTLPGRASSALSEAGGAEGYGGSFFQGVFATLLATPCTGPFLGTSLTFAFSQPGPVTLLFFASMATGMSLPYLALSAQPAWVRYLPKPGPWMERLKQFMGFPLLAALVWLLSIIGGLGGVGAIVTTSAFLLTLGLALWLYGIASSPTMKVGRRVILQALAAALAIGGGVYFLIPRTEMIAWVPYSTAGMDKLLSEGKPVFVDFTADWCISCKYNERTAIDTAAVRREFAKLGVVPVKADWTKANPEISAALQHFGRVGVPFYVLYPAGKPDSPITLPEFITQQMVLDALAKARLTAAE